MSDKLTDKLDTLLLTFIPRDNERRAICCAILDWIDKEVLPKKKRLPKKVIVIEGSYYWNKGYNQALTDIHTRLEGYKK